MSVLILDNYDSFTYNIVELLRQLAIEKIVVKKNDAITIEEASLFQKIIISPGPSIPDDAGISTLLIERLAPTHSILGICLGHQAIATVFGGVLKNIALPFHGFQTELEIVKPSLIFQNIHSKSRVGLYHSWVVDEANFPSCLSITSYSKEGYIMSLQHNEYDVQGVQFHPESYMTTDGIEMIKNWIEN